MSTDMGTDVCRICTENWINIYLNPRKNVDKVEVFVMVAAVFMMALTICAPRRRQSQSIIIRYGVEGVFILSYPLIIYTLGLMGGQHIIRSELYPLWGLFLAMLFGGTNAMSFQKLDENKHSMKLYWNVLLLMFYVGTMSGLFLIVGNGRPFIWFIAICINILFGVKSLEQWGAAKLARKPSPLNGIPQLASHMKSEHHLNTSYDPRTMHGYKYQVLIHLDVPVTLDTIWCGNIGVFSSSKILLLISAVSRICVFHSPCSILWCGDTLAMPALNLSSTRLDILFFMGCCQQRKNMKEHFK